MMVARCRVLVLVAFLAPCSSFRAVARPARLSAAKGSWERGAFVCASTTTATDAEAAAIGGAFRTPTTATTNPTITSTAAAAITTRRRRCFSLALKADAGTGDGG
ncbi:unnamed protein product, partial [Laminaria digitata]